MPTVLSLETRARIIADKTESLPREKRRQAVEEEALKQLREAVAVGSLSELAREREPSHYEGYDQH